MENKNCPKEIIGEKTSADLDILSRGGIIEGFYLAGGTGLALTLKHRLSYDLDFFSQKVFVENVLAKKIADLGKFEVEKKEPGTLHGLFGNTRLSFLSYPYRLLFPLETICGISVANTIDIACMKIDAISSRGSKKDFIDLYEILKQGHSLKELFDYFSKKYAELNYNLNHIQKGLIYFDDAEKEESPIMIKPIDWKKIKEFFKTEIKKLAN
ncbi:MAG: nucleotidyl transferase AbiEii/AbiGii toxin family protein [Candidatus Parcubacteria bacterium]|nr:nucleotidyl transferase AbiEii/AbiGii toxin family protein [Candidatus Parcubacteria bacterium]